MNLELTFIGNYCDVPWLPKNSSMDIALCNKIIPDIVGKTISVFAFVFSGDNVVILEHANKDRGLEIPGGHVEPGETVFEALEREVIEEIAASIKDVEIFGAQIITKDIPEDKYPDLLSNQLFFIANLDKYEDTEVAPDSLGALEIDKYEFLDHLKENNSYYALLYEAALTKLSKIN